MNILSKQKLSKIHRYINEIKIHINISLEKLLMSISGRVIKPEDTILIAGSGRSGTSWIQNTLAEIIKFQPIFEPLNPNFILEAKGLLGVEQKGEPGVTSPYLRSRGDYPEWDAFLSRALTGKVRNLWTDKKRFSFSPRGYITKLIRANFMLGYISRKFNPKIIFVMRHPCAVVFSRMKLNWYVNLDFLLSNQEIIADYIGPYLSDIKKETDPVGIHAIWWSLEQMIAMDSLKGMDYFFVHYEDIYLSKYQKFNEIINWLGQGAIYGVDHTLVPPATDESGARISQWVSGLNPDQIGKILWWANRFGIDHYDNQIYPRCSADQYLP